MKKNRSLLKTSVAAIGILEIINRVIDSASTANSNTRTGGKYYHWKHGDIYYRVFGDKENPPLLLLHDLTVGSSSFEWLEQAKKLSDTFCVYCPDLIGCGKSEKPAITYTNYFYVQMLTDFVRDVIGQRTRVAATGLSGSFLLMANSMNQDLFGEIMLVNPVSIQQLKKNPDDRSKIIMKLFGLPVIGKTLYYILTNRANTEYYLTENCMFNSFHMEPSVTKSYYNSAHNGKGNGKYLLASIDSNYLCADITNALRKSENPITIVTGAHLPNAEEIVKGYRSIRPELNWHIISESKQLPQLESVGEMLELMYIF